jgi:mRNA-degrading endonuclease toxin of MazEF toxin-antitoxin module
MSATFPERGDVFFARFSETIASGSIPIKPRPAVVIAVRCIKDTVVVLPATSEDSERTELPSASAVPAPNSKSVRPEVVEELVRETLVRLAPIGPKQAQFLAAIAKLRGAGATPEEIERFKESFKKD